MVDFSQVLIGDIFGCMLALPISLFLAFWISAVKSRVAVVIGALLGCLLGFLGILAWAWSGTLTHVDGGATFFSAVLLCSVAGLSAGILTDLLIARKSRKDYLRSTAHEQQHA
jgi:hypothetical protein